MRRPEHHIGTQCVHVKRCGTQRRHHVHHKQRGVPGRVNGRAHGSQVTGHAAGGIGVHGKHRNNFVPGVGTQRGFNSAHINRVALNPGRADHAHAKRLSLYRPRFRKVAGARHQCRLPGCQQVHHYGFPRAVPIGCVHENIGILGVQQRLEPRFAGGNDGINPRIGQVHGLAAHGLQHFARHVRGARCVQKTVAGNACWRVHGMRVVGAVDCIRS